MIDQPSHCRDIGFQATCVGMVEPVEFERQHRERGAQLMRDVGGKCLLPRCRVVQTPEQLVDGIRERQCFGRHPRRVDSVSALMPARRLDLHGGLFQRHEGLSDDPETDKRHWHQ